MNKSVKSLYYIKYSSNKFSQEAMDFVIKWHYSKSCRSLKQLHVFELKSKDNNNLIGVAIYGQPMSRHYNKDGAIELRRLCCISNTPKNTESYFISKTIKWLERNTDHSYILTYADPNKGHQGVIYKASNWEFDGLEDNPNPRVLKYQDKDYHIRQLYQKKCGHYTKNALQLQEEVKEGNAQIVNVMKKLRYKYYFRG